MMRSSHDSLASNNHIKTILKLTILHRTFVYILLFISSQSQRNFDTSPSLQLLTSFSTSSPILNLLALPLLRWDGLHFLGVASPIPLPIPPSTSSEHVQIPPSFGYNSEHTLAWQSGLEWILRATGWIGSSLEPNGGEWKWNPIHSILFTSLLAGILSLLSPLLLYRLTLRQTSSHRFSYLTTILSILSPSPTTLITPSPESFFSFFTLLGLYLLAPSSPLTNKPSNLFEWIELFLGTLCLLTAALFRANGILLVGFVWWKLGWEKNAEKSSTSRTTSTLLRILSLPILTLLVWTPFLSSQRWAYSRFCSQDAKRPWCHISFPSVYSFVQEQYWNVGFLRYWTLSQLPNFLLASPVLILAGLTCWNYYASDLRAIVVTTLFPWIPQEAQETRSRPFENERLETDQDSKAFSSSTSHSIPQTSTNPQKRNSKQDSIQSEIRGPQSQSQTEALSNRKDFQLLSFKASPSLLPHNHFTLLTLLILIFNSHTQISLRFSTPGGLPAVWWGFAWVLMREERERRISGGGGEGKGLGWKSKLLIGWLVVWNVVSVVLTGGFYPPA